MRKYLLALLSSFLLVTSASAAIDVFEFDNEEQEQQFKELSAQLRCPKCQNNAISDSNAELAQDLRKKVYEMTKEGKDSDEIVEYMIDRYGNFVTYKPPFTAATSILWLGPFAVVLLGFGIIVYRSRKKTVKVKAAQNWDEDKEARLKALLEEDENGDKQ
ncbi:cytochrome c-type biogenesis protein CcmH [Vibrio sp. JC009]|uniref:cytochrome c-type biogenesis protein n=1 Tax=Vibrio sp. JC009 TaxID=2912314 RepID=UPI0023AED6C8|nr:cytochrome c-type biogenesis protein [Vibrio sp. JC009]WED21031.1 cytochrome c-type biogenesis protein CcmH [Vibrio sp. JC009]